MVSRRVTLILAGTCLMVGGCGRSLERVAPNWFPPDGSRPGATQREAVASAAAAAERPAATEPASVPEAEVEPPPPPRPVIDAAAVAGFTVRDLETGDGLVVGPESRVRMSFTARIVGGDEFQRVDEPIGPWPVTELIPGLAQGLAGMAAGGRRRITIPPDLGYEDTPVTDPATGEVLIPAGSTLEYDVTLVGIDGGVEPEPEEAAEPADSSGSSGSSEASEATSTPESTPAGGMTR